MTRWAFASFAALSLVLCLLFSVLWVRSRFASDVLEWTTVGRTGSDIIRRESRLLVGDTGERSSIRFVQTKVLYGGVDPLAMEDLWQEQNRRAGLRFRSLSWAEVEVHDHRSMWNQLGFYRDRSVVNQRAHGRVTHMQWATETLGLPLWPLPAATAVAPALWSIGTVWRHRSRRRQGRCARCGYDLRATPGHCPECGWMPRRPRGSAAARPPVGEADSPSSPAAR